MKDDSRKIIGYTLSPIYETLPGAVVTKAFVRCYNCGTVISSTGGPRANAFCLNCAEHLDFINLIKGN